MKFPELRTYVRGNWMPIQIEPILGSGERLTIGVIAYDEKEAIVLLAPGLKRLECLYE